MYDILTSQVNHIFLRECCNRRRRFSSSIFYLHTFHIFCYFLYDEKLSVDVKASDVVRQPKVADVSRGIVKENNAEPVNRLRSNDTIPDGVYTRNSGDGDSVNVGIEWPGGDVRDDFVILDVLLVAQWISVMLFLVAFYDFVNM